MLFLPRVQRISLKAATSIAVKISQMIDGIRSLFYCRGNDRINLLILDDFFPDVLSAFRVAEYNQYLENIAGTEVHSLRPSNLFFTSKGCFEEKLHEYSLYHKGHAGKVRRFNKRRIPDCKLVYTLFLNNIYRFIDEIDRHQLPFAFTLYPGGGFFLKDPNADRKLRRVFSSPNFRKVFVTQQITRQYLLDNGYCNAEDIVFIYGCVLPSAQLSKQPAEKRRYRVDKNSFDICFVAAKYTERGVDKGYDVFIEVAKVLCERYPDVKFHVVGSFAPSDIDVSSLGERITFYGLRNTDFFPEFYARMDLVLSPNVPFVIAPGAFDGFPTGSCMEAGLCGVAVFCSDPLGQNIAFRDGEEIVIVPRDAAEIVRLIEPYYQSPGKLYQLAEHGKRAFSTTLGLEAQMAERMKVLEQLLDEPVPALALPAPPRRDDAGCFRA